MYLSSFECPFCKERMEVACCEKEKIEETTMYDGGFDDDYIAKCPYCEKEMCITINVCISQYVSVGKPEDWAFRPDKTIELE